MNEYVFQLYYQLPESEPDPEAWLDALFEAGCDDALVGVAVAGHTMWSVRFPMDGWSVSDLTC